MSLFAASITHVSESQADKAGTVNAAIDAVSAAAIFAVKSVAGLAVTFYGGNMNISGTPTAIADQAITLTDNATNYIYSTSAGVYTKTTSAPTGWPGPISSPANAIAMHSFVTASGAITTHTPYITGTAPPGSAGATGATGAPGTDIAGTRKRVWTAVGDNTTSSTVFGMPGASITGVSSSARALSSSSFRESVPYLGFATAGSAGSGGQVAGPQNFCYLGNAAGRGGFTLSMRFCMENTVNASPANMRSFFGLFVPATIGNVEPDTLTSIIGVGSLAGDSNFRIFNNDGSGTATKTAFGTPSNFPVRATDNVYELSLTSVANSGVVTGSLTDVATGNTAPFSISSDLPSNTTFLSWVAWVNNGSTAAVASFGLMQVVAETRY